MSSRIVVPPRPSRRERRLAARAAAAHQSAARGGTHRGSSTRRRLSPMAWITLAAGVAGLALVGALLVLQGSGPRSTDIANLQPPILALPTDLAEGRTLGRADAPVTLEVWSDYQCRACGEFAELVEPAIVRDYVTAGVLRIVDHDAAFQGARVGAVYDESVEAGAGARCAAEQGAYWPFHDWLFANQAGENQGAFRADRLRAIATAAGLDVGAWEACLATGEQQAAVRAETQRGLAMGINATPTMFLNGQAIVGVRSAAELGQMIEAAAAATAAS